MRRLTADDLRRITLARQFPSVDGQGPDAVLDLFGRLGPIQSQVPRAPFVAAAARLPGTTYDTVAALFDTHQLLKASNLRGTVHTCTRRHFGALDVVATRSREPAVRKGLQLRSVTPAEVSQEVRRFCADDWRRRDDVVDHLRAWLAERESPETAEAVVGTFSESMLWGNSGLLRRPEDGAWERRTDVWRRTARTLVPELDEPSPDQGLVQLVRGHLAAHGPVTRRDLSFFFGVGLTQVDRAVAVLGGELVILAGPGRDPYLDLADPPSGGTAEPGVRLLAEFDALLLGFAGGNRNRFVDQDGLSRIWAKANGMFKPVVLSDGRLVATWRTRTQGRRTDLELTMLSAGRPLPEDLLAGPAADLGRVLDLQLTDVRVLPPG